MINIYCYFILLLILLSIGINKPMTAVPAYKIQDICCDATSVHIPEGISFFFKSSYHNVCTTGRVHVDFSLHVLAKPVQPLGIWRCRVNFWLQETVNEMSEEQGFEYFKEGFRAALAGAEQFVQGKYRVTSIMAPPTDEELLVRYKAILKKQAQS